MKIGLSSLQIVRGEKTLLCAFLQRCYFCSQNVGTFPDLKTLRLDVYYICIWRENVKSVIGLLYTECVETHVTNPQVQTSPTLAGLQSIAVVSSCNYNLGFVADE